MPIVEVARYSREEIRANRNRLFVFGDNLAERGLSGQAREARGEPNAVGVVTKRAPNMGPNAFLRDRDLALVAFHWRQAFSRLNAHLFAGGVVVWPADGVGTGLAQLETRAPALWRELQVYIAGMRAVAETVEECREADS